MNMFKWLGFTALVIVSSLALSLGLFYLVALFIIFQPAL